MARPLRIEYHGAFYHGTSCGKESKRIFFGSLLHCYVLMINHYYLFTETPHGNLSKVMHYFNASYKLRKQKAAQGGHLFQGRYKAILVDQDTYPLELSRYLHLNPVRANLVTKPEDYSHSSYRCYIWGKKEEIVTRDFILAMISKDYKDASRRYRGFEE